MQKSRARRVFLALLGGAAVTIGVAACATDGKPVAKPAAARPAPPRERVNKAVELLFQGKPVEARPLLVSALEEQPTNDVARKLLSQIDRDPKALLGEKSYPYRARAEDTASSLAARFLNDPLMFYAFARYNQIDPPSQSLAGRTVLIPGEPKRAPTPPATAAKPAAPKPARLPPPPAARNPARAAELRAAGLVQMNRGAIDPAVAILRQAAALDPANAGIQRDLERALRVQRTLRTR